MGDPTPQPSVADFLEKKLVSGAIDRSELKQFADSVSRLERYKLVDWCVLGQPAPDHVCARFEVGRDIVGDLINEILAGKLRTKIEIFPNGIPRPDLFEVNVSLGENPGKIRG